jgi:RNA polymerase sigma-70 factor (ECF subfamily)
MTTEALFREHAAFVARFLRRLGVPAEHADDALQEVFLVVHRNGGYRPGAAKPTSYLARIAIHAATNHRRRERLDKIRHSDASLEYLPSESADPTRAMQTQQDLARLQAALECLPEALQTTLLLVELEGESCLSVAAALGWPVGTVYWRLHEARKRFQVALRSVDAARSQQRSGMTRPESKERRRALRVPSFGMFTLFGGGSAFERSEAARLLRLGRAQPPATGALESSLARHQSLVKSGADLPAWAASRAPHTATWFGLIGASATAAIAAALALPLTAALVLHATSAPPGRSAAPLTAARNALSPAPIAALPTAVGRAVAGRQSSTTSTDSASPRASLASAVVAPASADEPVPTTARHPRDVSHRANTSIAPKNASGVAPTADRADLAATPVSRGLPAGSAVSAASVAHSLAPAGSASTSARKASSASPAAGDTVALTTAADSTSKRSSSAVAIPLAANSASPEPRARGESSEPSNSAEAAPLAAPRPRASTDAELLEMRDIGNAERLIATEPARALAIVQHAQQRFPDGYFGEERAYVEIMALFGLGRLDEARAKAADFLRTYPDGAYSRRVRHAAQSGAR